MVLTRVSAPGLNATAARVTSSAPCSSPSSIATRSFNASAKSISPCMARSVMAAVSSLRPARAANSSRVSVVMMVQSMSATRSDFRRPAAGCANRSTAAPDRASRTAVSAACGLAPEKGISQASPGESQSASPASTPITLSALATEATMVSSSPPTGAIRVRTVSTGGLIQGLGPNESKDCRDSDRFKPRCHHRRADGQR